MGAGSTWLLGFSRCESSTSPFLPLPPSHTDTRLIHPIETFEGLGVGSHLTYLDLSVAGRCRSHTPIYAALLDEPDQDLRWFGASKGWDKLERAFSEFFDEFKRFDC